MMPKIRILLVETHTLLREGLHRILADHPEFMAVYETGDGVEALQYCKTHCPDLVLLSLILPKNDGLQFLRDIKLNRPEIRVLVLSLQGNTSLFKAAMIAGADGYCSTDTGRDELLSAIHHVLDGRKYFSRKPRSSNLLPPQDELSRRKDCEPHCSVLSQREKEVLQLVVEGYTNRQIATALYISYRTVDNHCTRIREKLGVHSKRAITAFALRAGLAQ